MGFYPNPPNPAPNFFGIPTDATSLLIGLAIVILIFLVIREILCWYWKINNIVDLLEDIKYEISRSNKALKNISQESQEINNASNLIPQSQPPSQPLVQKLPEKENWWSKKLW